MTIPGAVRAGTPFVVSWVSSGPPSYVSEDPPPPSEGSLDALSDVAGAAEGLPGDVLVKGGDGVWRPDQLGAGATFHVTHNQVDASNEWIASYADLPFSPAGIRVILSDGSITNPGIDDDPLLKQFTFFFSEPRSGRVEMGA